jgi:hypothetical protein
MSGTDYKANMQSIAQQMNIHQVISNPMALLGGMAYARMQENDIEPYVKNASPDEEIYEENRLFVERYEQQLAISNAIAK